MNTFLCCEPSIDQENWTSIIATSPGRAAEEYASTIHEDYYPLEKGPNVTIAVWVKDENNNETRWLVERTFQPCFTAAEE